MNIYTAIDRSPYTYLIGWSKLDKWYYGVRYAKGCHPIDLWNPYKTSSSEVKNFIDKFGEPDIISVRKVFNNITSARKWESTVQKRMNVILSNKWINKSYGFGPKNLECLIPAKSITTQKTYLVSKEEFAINNDLVGIMFGLKNPNLSNARKGQSVTTGYTNQYRKDNGFALIPGRPKNSKTSDIGKLNMSLAKKNKARVKDINSGKIFYTDKNNTEIGRSLILYPASKVGRKGKPHSIETKQKIKQSAQNRETHFCADCNRNITGNSNWNRHLLSNRHIIQSKL